ncbi:MULTISPECIES: ribonuclease HII [Psychrobacter]|jgi:ribonuclease HII|uniref:Ribonuclease HII n=1 Tax=Psychrobacter immobilis TaxID=498 RepID=A0A2V2A5N3_PSYIM|nr:MULTISPECIES: ribonuclease HII [Psychrobacter]MCG3871370.1 ribonuclease HII [Psychrobacter sp. Ps7]MDN5560339.1 ribonuclease HII [Psychrobacter sp.]PWK14781.1 RNase HII [Psychrobacter immobilis]
MSNQYQTDNFVTPIEISIEQIDIKGQYLQLVEPIRLSGQVDIDALLAQYRIEVEQGLQQSTLQMGVDEAGRGPLLGSVNVAAAILPKTWSGLIEMQPLKDTPLSILTDSKQLSEKKRDRLYPLVQQHAIGYVVAEIPAAVIDQVNILQATMLGMRLCTEVLLKAIAHPLVNSMRQVEVLFDGNRCPELNEAMLAELGIEKSIIDCQAWVKGDARHTSIAAASILAKVSRDKAMYALDAEHPEYGIAKHKGYPTRAHVEAIEKYGVLSAHRRSFAPVRKSLEKAI